MPPPMRRRRRDAQGGRGRPERRPVLDQHHQLKTALQSELAPTVLHVRSPSAGLSSQTAPSVGGRTSSLNRSRSDGDPRRARLDDHADGAASMPADREPRQRRVRARRSATRSSPTAGRPGFVGVACTGPDADVVGVPPRRSPRASGSRARPAGPGRPARAPRATGMSSWPTCTPSAPAAPREVGPVVDDQQRAGLVAQRAARSPPRRSSSASPAPCRAAGRCRRRRERRGQHVGRARAPPGRAGDEVQRGPRSGARGARASGSIRCRSGARGRRVRLA